MMDRPAFEMEPYRTRLEATVLRVGEEEGRPYAVLDDTILFPEGGGQPADRGCLGEVAVVDVQKRSSEVRHYLAAPVEPGPVTVSLDWARRFDHMQQHTGQHLLTAVAQDRMGWKTTSFHLGERVSDVELDTAQVRREDLSWLEEAVAGEIRAARSVTCRRVTREELPALAVRSRGLPEGFQGDIRLVEIAGVDLNTCGGTHLGSTAELEGLKLLGTEPVRGGTRVYFVAGNRLRERLGLAEERLAELRALLGAPDLGLKGAVEEKLEQIKALERKARSLEEALAGVTAEHLATLPGGFVEQHFEGKDAGFLQKILKHLATLNQGKTAFLTGEAGGQAFFVLGSGEGVADPGSLGREVANQLAAKGGGSGRLFQGKTGSLEGRAGVVAWLRSQVEPPAQA